MSIGNNIFVYVKKMFLWMLAAISIYILGLSFLVLANQKERVKDNAWLPIFLVLATIISVYLFYVISKRIIYLNIKIWEITIFSLIIALQLYFLFGVADIYPITDCYTTIDEAISMHYQKGLLDNNMDYFARYPNNYLFTILMYYAFFIPKLLGGSYFKFAVLMNIAIIDFSILLAMKIIKKIIGEKNGLLFLLFFSLSPTNYVFVFFPYTNTFSIPIMLGIIVLGLSNNIKSRYIAVALSVFGYCLRPTTIFVSIGVAFYWILQLIKNKGYDKKSHLVIRFCGGVVLGIVVAVLIQAFVSSHLMNKHNEKGFPITHWIMVGLKGSGEITGADVDFTESFESRNDKIEANLMEIKNRVSKLGISGVLKTYLKKIGKEWAVGTDDFQNYCNSDKNYSNTYELFFGENNTWLIVYSQIYRCLIFFFITIMMGQLIVKKHVNDEWYIFIIAILGSIIFLMIWETNKKHTICYTYILGIMMQYGISIFTDLIDGIKEKKIMVFPNRIKIIRAVGVLLIVSGVMIGNDIFINSASEKKIIYKSEFNMETIVFSELKKKEIKQYVQVNKDFETIKLHTKRRKNKGGGYFKVKIFGKKILILDYSR